MDLRNKKENSQRDAKRTNLKALTGKRYLSANGNFYSSQDSSQNPTRKRTEKQELAFVLLQSSKLSDDFRPEFRREMEKGLRSIKNQKLKLGKRKWDYFRGWKNLVCFGLSVFTFNDV